MSTEPDGGAVREAVGIFHDAQSFQNAVDELLSSGFHRAELSLLASEDAVEEKLGHRYQRVDALADDPAVPRQAYVSTEAIGDAEGGIIGGLTYVGATAAAVAVFVSGGALAAAIAAAALAGGAGGLIGSALAMRVGEHHAHYLQEQIDHGGLLLWVATPTGQKELRAVSILRKYCAGQVHLHGTALADAATG